MIKRERKSSQVTCDDTSLTAVQVLSSATSPGKVGGGGLGDDVIVDDNKVAPYTSMTARELVTNLAGIIDNREKV